MELFDAAMLKNKAYRDIFIQKGGGNTMNHFMNSMNGEGLANYFGTVIKKTIPLNSSSIKGSTSKKNSSVSSKANARKRSVVVHTPHKKAKWQNL